MSDLSAIPGGAVFDTFQKLVERPVIKKETTRQTKIASLVNSDGFKAIQEVIDRMIDDLRDIPIDPKTDTPESVGFRYLASKVTIEYLTNIRNLPQRQDELAKLSENKNE